ncbi:MAG: hypothetical protein Q9164_005256, partial [Protoblastenia rupestris]
IVFQDPSDSLNNYTTSFNASIARSTLAIPVPTSTSAISSSRETTSENKDANTTNYIVIGTTIPVLVIAFLLVGVLITWRWKKGMRQASSKASVSHAQPYLQQKAELEHAERRRYELNGEERRYEMAADLTRQEILAAETDEDHISHEMLAERAPNRPTIFQYTQELRGEEYAKELEAPASSP